MSDSIHNKARINAGKSACTDAAKRVCAQLGPAFGSRLKDEQENDELVEAKKQEIASGMESKRHKSSPGGTGSSSSDIFIHPQSNVKVNNQLKAPNFQQQHQTHSSHHHQPIMEKLVATLTEDELFLSLNV